MIRQRKAPVIGTTKIDSIALGNLLKRVHISGLVDECAMQIKQGIASVQAIDLTNSVFLSCMESVNNALDVKFGLTKIGLLCKFFDDGNEQISCVLEKRHLILMKKNSGEIKLQLAEPEQISTIVTQEDAVDRITKNVGIKFTLDSKAIKNLQYYLSLVKCDSVVFTIQDGAVTVSTPPQEHLQFKTDVGVCDRWVSLSVEVYAKYLQFLLRTLELLADPAPIIVGLGKDAPVVFQQGQNLWALTPVVGD